MYIVIELQNGTVGKNNWTFDDQNAAFAKYFTILAVAAVSSVKCHAAVILREDGLQIAAQSFKHGGEENE